MGERLRRLRLVWEWVLPALVIAAAVLIYTVPYWGTWRAVGYAPVPPLLATNHYLYLNLSQMESLDRARVRNPWYGVGVLPAEIGHVRFGGLPAFGVFKNLSGTDWSIAALSWTGLFVGLSGLTGWWLFRTMLTSARTAVIALGLGLLLLTDLPSFTLVLSAWRQLPSMAGFESRFLELPYLRLFYPQAVIPIVLSYAALLIIGLRGRDWKPWAGMVVLQLGALILFPYALLVMGLFTALPILVLIVTRQFKPRALLLVACAVAAMVLDAVYVMLTRAPGGDVSGMTTLLDATALIQSAPTIDVVTVLLIAAVVWIGYAWWRGKNVAALVLAAWGLASLSVILLPMFDSPMVQLGDHVGYLLHTTLAVLGVYVLGDVFGLVQPRFARIDWVYGLGTAVLLANGLLMAVGTTRHNLPENQLLSDLVPIVQGLELGEKDLVIAPSSMGPLPDADMPAVWLPLVTRAQVLYSFQTSYDGLPRANEKAIVAPRYALYLTLTGRDAVWLETQLKDPRGTVDPGYLISLGLIAPAGVNLPDAETRYVSLRDDLLPQMEGVMDPEGGVQTLLGQYGRIVLIDIVSKPWFDEKRIEDIFRVENKTQRGEYVVYELARR